MSPPPAPEPARLGKYRIVRPLQVGGTAAIYLAVLRGENSFSREVVIKRPLAHLVADARARVMFIDEAHIASRLSHPNICQVLDLVARDDELYLVLEYLKGVDLREVLKRCVELGRLPPIEVAVWTAIEVAQGLDFAHEAVAVDGTPLHVIHRDVSPKNIRITDAGSVKVIDFGIARARNRETETAVGTIKGTLGYMSPEQILGDEIDRRSDVFTFGICLFQMLTCRNPFDGSSLKERVRRLTQAPIPSVRDFCGALDTEIETIVARCLERDVERRYPRMRDVQLDLDRYLARLQVVSPRQRLIEFLEEIFPHLHDADPELKIALTEASGASGRIDTDQRLRFPDDVETEPPAAPPRSADPVAGRTVSTVKDDALAALGPGAREDREVHDTKPPKIERSPGELVAADGPGPLLSSLAEAGASRGHVDRDAFDASSFASTSIVAQRRSHGALGIVLAAAFAVIVIAMAWVAYWASRSEIDEAAIPTAFPRDFDGAAGGITSGATVARSRTPTTSTISAVREERAVAFDSTGTERRAATKEEAPGTPPSRDRSKERARLYFRAALALEREGHAEDALLLYLLSYEHSGADANAALYRNLGRLHDKAHSVAKATACFRGYLDRRPAASDAGAIRATLASYPPSRHVRCVDGADLARARRLALRRGAAIDAWLREAASGRNEP